MKLIVGLGNPGREYENSRHNFGFRVIDRLASQIGEGKFKKSKFEADVMKGRDGDHPVVLAKPVTFMNLSGRAVFALMGFYKCSRNDLLVIHDDLDLELGRIKLAAEGSAGGHRGVASIIEALNTTIFFRLRLGIGRPANLQDAVDYVLAPFFPEEEKKVEEVLVLACEAIGYYLTRGLDKAMEKFNRRPQ